MHVLIKNDKDKLKPRQPYHVVDINDEIDPMATIQKQDNQFRAKRYKVKRSELLKMPSQTYRNRDPLEENMQTATYEKLKDEIFDDNPTVLSTLVANKLKEKIFNMAPGDYDALLKQLEEDDELQYAEQEIINPSASSSTPLETPSPTISSNMGDSDQSNSSYNSSWLLPTPNNSPSDASHLSIPVDNETLAEALQSVAHDLLTFNANHPTPPGTSLRRSQRQTTKPESYLYNGRKIPTRRK